MSLQIEKVFQEAYDAEVKRAYGQVGMLRDTVYTKTGIVGKATHFRKLAKALATKHVPLADRVNANVDINQVKCNLSDWECFDYIDKMSMPKINFSEVKEMAMATGDALGLRLDQIIIDAVNAGYEQGTMKFGTSGEALKVEALIDATTALDNKGVPSSERVFLHTAKQKADLLKTTKVTSTDYNSVKALVNGEINTFMGLNFKCIAKRAEGGLPNDGTNDIGFIYHKRAVGLAIGQDIKTEMAYLPEKGCYIVGGSFSAGAVVIDNEGVAAIQSVD